MKVQPVCSSQPDGLSAFAPERRLWQGIPSIALSRSGRIFAAYYSGGITEQYGNYCVLAQSDDGGASFSDPVAVLYAGENARCYDAALWLDPLGRLWFIFATAPDYHVWACVCDDPDAGTLSWHAPRVIGEDVMLNKPIVAPDGAWLFPMAVWRKGVQVIAPTCHENGLAYVYETRDQGKTFQRLGGANVPDRWFDEHMILPMKNGRLRMLVRTTYGIGQSESEDGGKTWTTGGDSGIPGPCSRFHLRRLRSGRILLINHYQFSGRNNLAAWLSEDEMQSWKGILMLDERKEVSYPDADEDDQGNIFIIYDRERGAQYNAHADYSHAAREILLARVTEEDILAGSLVCRDSFLRRTVSRLGDRPCLAK